MRLRHIDFLRGIAIILVLFRHCVLTEILYRVGWVGVDLFFVLSGFLVSGILFHEYQKYNSIKPGLFLIRRGLKIYPLFYSAIIFSELFATVYNWTSEKIFRSELLAELLFVQNYFSHIWEQNWSLAVEEHFYLVLVLIIFILYKKKLLENRKVFTGFFVFIAVSCLSLRLWNYTHVPYLDATHLYPTHLRIDSLMFGVYLSYMYNYEKEKFVRFFQKYKYILIPIALFFLTPCIFFDIGAFFMNTFGLTMLYLGFGTILSVMMVTENINVKLNKIFGKITVNIVSKIGFYSYSIYLWHLIVLKFVLTAINKYISPASPNEINFTIYFIASILAGIGISKLIEQPFLKFRDRRFPSRSKAINISSSDSNVDKKIQD